MGGGVVRAVGGIDLRVERGALIAVKGRSGSGKTTLLSLIGALERPSAGSVVVDGLTVSELSEAELVAFRRSASASSSRPSACCRSCRPPRMSRCRCG